MTKELTLLLLAETNLEGYKVMCDPLWTKHTIGPGRILAVERELRASAEAHEIDLTPYPNADLAERNLA